MIVVSANSDTRSGYKMEWAESNKVTKEYTEENSVQTEDEKQIEQKTVDTSTLAYDTDGNGQLDGDEMSSIKFDILTGKIPPRESLTLVERFAQMKDVVNNFIDEINHPNPFVNGVQLTA